MLEAVGFKVSTQEKRNLYTVAVRTVDRVRFHTATGLWRIWKKRSRSLSVWNYLNTDRTFFFSLYTNPFKSVYTTYTYMNSGKSTDTIRVLLTSFLCKLCACVNMLLLKWTLTFDYNTINKVKEVSLNLSLSSGRLKDLMEILDLHRHQIVQSLALLSSLVTSLFKTGDKALPLSHTQTSLMQYLTFDPL